MPKETQASDRIIQRRDSPSIIQGATDESRTQFSVLHKNVEFFEYFVTDEAESTWYPDKNELHEFTGQSKSIAKVYFSSLQRSSRSGEVLRLHVIDGKTRETVDTREFKMLDLTRQDLRFAVCTCMDDERHQPSIWKHLIRQQPNFIIFAGDSVYCDRHEEKNGIVDPAHLWRRFSEARSTLEIYFSKRLVPIFATWDDHDFGKNDTGKWFPYIKESQENFLRFFAQEPSHCEYLERGPGVSSAFRFGSHLFLLLDDRSFRHKKGSRDRYAQWGQEQEKWALEQINRHSSAPSGEHSGTTWIVNGSQFFPVMFWKESVAGDHPEQMQGFLQELRRLSTKVVFVSGDVHFSEISEIEPDVLGYRTYEITSSAIHSQNYPGFPDVIPNRRRIASTGKNNYVLLEVGAEGKSSQIKATSISDRGETCFTKTLRL